MIAKYRAETIDIEDVEYEEADLEEDVLFTTIGHLGSASIVPLGFGEANMNQNFVKMTIDKNKINPYYLTTYLNSKVARKQVNMLLTGNIQSLLTYPKIKNIQIIIPKSGNIQEKIEIMLKKAFELQNEAMNLINNTLLKFNTMLNVNKSNINNKFYSIYFEELNSSPIWLPKYFLPTAISIENQIRNKFKCVDLSTIAYMFSGDEPGSDAYIDYLDITDDEIPFVRTSDIYNNQLDLFPDNYIDAATFNEFAQNIKNGDILFTKDGKIAEIAMVTSQDCAFMQSGIEIVRINEEGLKLDLTQEYLFLCMASEYLGKNTANRYTVTASTIPHLKEKNIGKMPVPLIPVKLIKEFSNDIKKAFDMLGKKKKLIKECRSIVNNIIKLKV